VPLEPYIDAHSHVWTPDVHHYPLAEGFTPDDMMPKSFTAEELLAQCRPAGVGRVNLIQMSYYKFDNSYMLDMIKLYPDRFVGTAIVDPLKEKVGERMEALRPRGVRSFRIQPEYSKLPADRWLQPEGYDDMFTTAARAKMSLSCLVNPNGFAEIDRMCAKYPETPVIIDHLGRVGIDGTIRAAELEALCTLAKHPNVNIKVGAFYALGAKKVPYDDLGPMIKRVVAAYGAKRCLWETDCPFQIDHARYVDSLNLIKNRLEFLSDEDRSWLLGKTAERVLFTP
jgi:predicted TIM-barrel fold metal-dependent hydrolase